MALNTDHLARCIKTLEYAIENLRRFQEDTIDYEMYRNSAVKGFELTLETAGKLLKKALKPYFSSSRAVDQLIFKDIFRYASKHGFLSLEEVERWFKYGDNRNNTAHDYGEKFAQETLKLLPQFVIDATNLKEYLYNVAT